MPSKTVFMAALDMNQPLEYYLGFQELLMQKGLLIDMLMVAEGDARVQVENKVRASAFVWVDDLSCMKVESTRAKVHEHVDRGGALLITALPAGFSSNQEDCDTTHLNRITEPFGIKYAGTKIHSVTTGRQMTLGPECFYSVPLFKGVTAVSVSSPWHLNINPPAEPLITGDESCHGITWLDRRDHSVRGNQLVCAAFSYTGSGGKVVVLSGIMLMDSQESQESGTIERNRSFAGNLVEWLSR